MVFRIVHVEGFPTGNFLFLDFLGNIQYNNINYTCILVTSKEKKELEVYSCEFGLIHMCSIVL